MARCAGATPVPLKHSKQQWQDNPPHPADSPPGLPPGPARKGVGAGVGTGPGERRAGQFLTGSSLPPLQPPWGPRQRSWTLRTGRWGQDGEEVVSVSQGGLIQTARCQGRTEGRGPGTCTEGGRCVGEAQVSVPVKGSCPGAGTQEVDPGRAEASQNKRETGRLEPLPVHGKDEGSGDQRRGSVHLGPGPVAAMGAIGRGVTRPWDCPGSGLGGRWVEARWAVPAVTAGGPDGLTALLWSRDLAAGAGDYRRAGGHRQRDDHRLHI